MSSLYGNVWYKTRQMRCNIFKPSVTPKRPEFPSPLHDYRLAVLNRHGHGHCLLDAFCSCRPALSVPTSLRYLFRGGSSAPSYLFLPLLFPPLESDPFCDLMRRAYLGVRYHGFGCWSISHVWLWLALSRSHDDGCTSMARGRACVCRFDHELLKCSVSCQYPDCRTVRPARSCVASRKIVRVG